MERDIVAMSQREREAEVPSFRDGYRGEDHLKGCQYVDGGLLPARKTAKAETESS